MLENNKKDLDFKNIDSIVKFINEMGLYKDNINKDLILNQLKKYGYRNYDEISKYIDLPFPNDYNQVLKMIIQGEEKDKTALYIVGCYIDYLDNKDEDIEKIYVMSKVYCENNIVDYLNNDKVLRK